jgi:hypothetical protein
MPIVPLPAITAGSLTGWTKWPSTPAYSRAGEDLEPCSERNPQHARAESLESLDLHRRRVIGRHHGARNPHAARLPGDTQRHVSRARGPHAARQRLARCGEHRVARAAQLEGSDRLQVLELEPDLRRRVLHAEPDQRRA